MNEQEFAQRLRQYRKDQGMTQQELADKLGVSNKTVSRWESGSYPDVTTLVALARTLGVTVDELLDPRAPVRTLEKTDWQNLLSFAFVIGGGLLFYLLAQFVPPLLCWIIYLGCVAYGIYLQANYTAHTRWFHLSVWVVVLFVSWSSVERLVAWGDGTLLGMWISGKVFGPMNSIISWLGPGMLIFSEILYALIHIGSVFGVSALTVWLAKRLVKESASGSVLSWLTGKEHPRLAFYWSAFHWSKAAPALAPIFLMGYCCLFWREDLPETFYLVQEEIYWILWFLVSILTLLPLLKRGNRGMLGYAVGLALADLHLSGLLVDGRVYNIGTHQVLQKGIGGLGRLYYDFGQPGPALILTAIGLALLYLLCCFAVLKPAPEKEKREETGADQEGTF